MRMLSYFSIRLPIYLTYMAQQVEYEPEKLIEWLKRRPALGRVMHRQKLVMTQKAAALVTFQYAAVLVYIIFIGMVCSLASLVFLPLAIFSPAVAIAALILAIYAGRLIGAPSNMIRIGRSRKIFSGHKGLKIAILGSYGKTTMKELLAVVLGEGKKVAATPGNKNVPISHARWAASLSGDEDVLLIEFGEGKPGDIADFCKNTSPDMAVITGIAPNHLDKYKTLDSVAEDLASAADYVAPQNIYVNSAAERLFIEKKMDGAIAYDQKQTGGIEIKDVKITLKGMSFSAVIDGKRELKLRTDLLGRHLLGPLAVCILLAVKLGLSDDEIIKGIGKTHPFEHRLQPKPVSGAWIIDDTYNGSLEGFRAGLQLLKELKAKRKIYVTPGLVDQGEETQNVHREIGRLIAQADPDKVVLIENSTTGYIKSALEENKYNGKLEIRDDPLEYYTNLEHTLASGDIVMLQNDWTDNYY